jgi:phytoene synthase
MTAPGRISHKKARRHVRKVVKQSGTSFGPGMRILSKERREAMYAIYAFCREIDDIADGDGAIDKKRKELDAWREEIERIYQGAPVFPTGAALLAPVNRFDLPKEEFILLIEGMEMDAEGPIVAPEWEGLFAYIRRVAGAVGMLSMPVFGAPRSEAARRFALSLADAFQITNILRDIEDDARSGRLYLPYEALKEHHCAVTPEDICDSPGLPPVRAAMAEVAREKFAQAREALKELDWKTLRPALLMMGVYENYLMKMAKCGWANGQPRVRLSRGRKSLIAARWFFAPKLKTA